jgi:hypothetical protein
MSENVSPKFHCDRCDCTFYSKFNLKRHWIRIHGSEYEETLEKNQNIGTLNQNQIINPLQCHQCQKVFTVNWYLQKHVKKCTGFRVSKYKCNYCDKTFQCDTSKYKHHKTCLKRNYQTVSNINNGLKDDCS